MPAIDNAQGETDDVAAPAVEFHPRRGVYTTEFEISSRPVSEAVVSAVSHASDRDPLEVPPLQRTIDTDALDSMFARTAVGGSRCVGELTFEYAGYLVTVRSHGTVEVESAVRPE